MIASCDLFVENRKSCSLFINTLYCSQWPLHRHPVCLSDYQYRKYPLKILPYPCKLHNQIQPVYVSAKCMRCANLLADGLACSEEVQEHEKMTRHQLVFSLFSSIALNFLQRVLCYFFRRLLCFQYMELWQTCMLFVPNNVVCTNY